MTVNEAILWFILEHYNKDSYYILIEPEPIIVWVIAQ